jgi:hypothetical protein
MMSKISICQFNILFSVALPILVAGCNKNASTAISASPPVLSPQTIEQELVTTKNAEGLSLLNYKFTKNSAGDVVIKGHVNNVSNRKTNLAIVKFKLLDKKGNEVGTVTTSVNNLEANFSWLFEVPVTFQDAAAAELVSITSK